MVPFQVQTDSVYRGGNDHPNNQQPPNAEIAKSAKVPRKGNIFHNPLWQNRRTNLMPGTANTVSTQRAGEETYMENVEMVELMGEKNRLKSGGGSSHHLIDLIHHMVLNWSITIIKLLQFGAIKSYSKTTNGQM